MSAMPSLAACAGATRVWRKWTVRICSAVLLQSKSHRCATLRAAVFDFIDRCMTGIATPLSTIRKTVANRPLPKPYRLLKHRDVAEAIIEVATTATVHR